MIKRNARYYDPLVFFAKAKAIHGDLYDYSETVLSGSQDPLSFKCKRCKTIRTLSQAQSHIRKKRPCGCKPCNMSTKHACKQCGKSTESPGFWKRGKRCEECHGLSKNKWSVLAKKESRSKLRLTAWERKCRSAVSSFSRRSASVCGIDCKVFFCWKKLIQHQLRRELWEKGCTAWEAKCMNAAKSLRKRIVKA